MNRIIIIALLLLSIGMGIYNNLEIRKSKKIIEAKYTELLIITSMQEAVIKKTSEFTSVLGETSSLLMERDEYLFNMIKNDE